MRYTYVYIYICSSLNNLRALQQEPIHGTIYDKCGVNELEQNRKTHWK